MQPHHIEVPTGFCSQCYQKLVASWAVMAAKARERQRRYKSVYGLTLEDYGRRFVMQSGRCAICHVDQSDIANQRLLVVDHCHTTGRVRGLLCPTCNTGLGMFRDEPSNLTRAIDYLGASMSDDQQYDGSGAE